MSGPALCAILPLSAKGGKEREDMARASLLAESLALLWSDRARLDLHVAAPADELDAARAALAPLAGSGVAAVFHDERAIVPGLDRLRSGGWHRQQMLKLAAPSLEPARFWLALDADVVCVRRFDAAALVPDGRARFDELDPIPANLRAWHVGAAELLGLAPPTRALSVTPALLAPDICAAVRARLENRHGAPWTDVLDRARTDPSWSEYALYRLAGEADGLLERRHARAPDGLSLIDWRRTLFDPAQIFAWDPAPAFDDPRAGFFVVASSYAGLPAEYVRARVEGPLRRAAATDPALP